MPKVLIVEDDAAMAVALRDAFQYEGFEAELARDGEEGLEKARQGAGQVIVLDVMLPKLSGLELLKRLRSSGSRVPVIMLTARGQERDKVVALEAGADDYVTKPFGFMELAARVQAVLRRSSGYAQGPERCRFGDVSVDFEHHEATKAGAPLELSARELRLLRYFIAKRGQVLGREQLLDAVWGYDDMPYTRTVDMHVAKLRKKIETRPAQPEYLLTVHRAGYKFVG